MKKIERRIEKLEDKKLNLSILSEVRGGFDSVNNYGINDEGIKRTQPMD